ncbi:hypothetical protein Acr_17g0007370 [Actinidia rufa]|uniref:Uncharacterized protein n=1 Tax=Actinidia rufa TaxID=165716 RepID=A0A7J0G302_9ERIC|nr:hypothetical protein Acr_17g0007370 [Actinidia rufa]
MALARTVPVLGNVSTALQSSGPPSLLHSDSSAAVPDLAWSELLIVYFIPFQYIYCGQENTLKPGDVKCRECGYLILHTKRTRGSKHHLNGLVCLVLLRFCYNIVLRAGVPGRSRDRGRELAEVGGFLGWQSEVVAGVEGVVGRSLEVGGSRHSVSGCGDDRR